MKTKIKSILRVLTAVVVFFMTYFGVFTYQGGFDAEGASKTGSILISLAAAIALTAIAIIPLQKKYSWKNRPMTFILSLLIFLSVLVSLMY